MSSQSQPLKAITIAHNAVHAKMVDACLADRQYVQQLLSYQADGMSRWDSRSSLFEFGPDTFPAGFVPAVRAALIRLGRKVNVVRPPLPAPLGPPKPVVDAFPEDPRYTYQREIVDKLLKHGQIIAKVATGGGKCLGRDTPILMFDGTIKMVQDVVPGDMLMGPDSCPRNVLSACAGTGLLYRVTPRKGDAYVVNDAHILSLKTTSRGFRGKNRDGAKYPSGEIVNINVKRYLEQTPTFRHTHKGWRTGVEFEGSQLPVDPYLLGVILGDGTINGTISVTNADPEILVALEEEASKLGLRCNVISKAGNSASAVYLTQGRTGGRENPLMGAFRSVGLGSKDGKAVRKFIPHIYKTASRADRLALLAGVIDTDGHYDGKGMYLTLKEEQLFDDVLFIARSLGFAAYKKCVKKRCHNNGVVGDYFSMVISGNLDEVPTRIPRKRALPRMQKKNPLVVGLCVEAIGQGEYFGFEVDGDHLFLLGDFTVTHNSRVAKLAHARIGRRTLFLTTRGILMHQMRDAFMRDLAAPVGIYGDDEWSKVPELMNVGMVQTFIARLETKTLHEEWKAYVLRRIKSETKVLEAQDIKLKKTGKAEAERTAEWKKLQKSIQATYPDEAVLKAQLQAKVGTHNRRRDDTIALLKTFELVILEEAHEVSSNSFFDVMNHCTKAYYRLALTGTPFMKDSEEANLRLQAVSGPIGKTVTEKQLIDCGILAKPFFKFIAPPPIKGLYRTTPYEKAVEVGIVKSPERTELIVREVKNAIRYGLTVLVLVQRKEHGKLLSQVFTDQGIVCNFIDGDHDQAGRQAAIQALKDGRIEVLIGSTILDVGVDVPAIGLGINAGGGKAEVAYRQRIGRTLREKRHMPNFAFFVDFTDPHNNHLASHARERRLIIEQTPGFAEGVVVGDFPYENVGLVARAA